MVLRARLFRAAAAPPLAALARPLVTTSVRHPRAGRPGARTLSAPAAPPNGDGNGNGSSGPTPTTATPSEPGSVAGAPAPSESSPSSSSNSSSSSPFAEAPADPDAPTGEPPAGPVFPAIVTTVTLPPPPTEPLEPEHHALFNHLATSFVPANQPCAPSSQDHTIMLPDGSVASPKHRRELAHDEPVVALVTPFEGGDVYVSRAVHDVAAHLSADVVRLDLALSVAFDGPNAPLRETGILAPPIPPVHNPVFFMPSSQPPEAPMHGEEDAGGEEDEQGMSGNMPGMTGMPGMPNMIRIPIAVGGVGGMPGGMFGAPRRRSEGDYEEDWVQFFSGIINMQLPEDTAPPAARRIILLESTAAMSESFETWWPSLLEAVRRRRRGPTQPRQKGKRAPAPTTTHPTTIVLSVPPSLLLPHTAEWRAPDTDDVESSKDRIRSVVEALGANVSAIHVDGGDKHEERLWWSSEEHDHEGRAKRDERRLRAIIGQGAESLLPFSTNQPAPQAGNPILDMILGRGKKKEEGLVDASIVWKTLPVIPVKRDLALEQHERTLRRRAINAAIMMRAVGHFGATLEEPLSMLGEPGSSPARGRERRLNRRKEPDPEWSELVIGWKEALDLASTAVGRAATSAEEPGPLVLTWKDILAARAVTIDLEKRVDDLVSAYLPTPEETASPQAEDKKEAPPVDAVVEALKKDKGLTKHEKRLLPCIVDATKLATASFKDVHLPFKTIDAIRTVISLPLLFPKAFQGGILKDHVTSGALLFGPPGTGKTLLARAIASESGARMLAIQPSDVNDMWVGEGEKLVKAVFNLARRLSPCVVFIDEVDSLFGARSARDSSGGSKAHNQILTEFMQEMDGLSSASANRDKRVVVVGATNRPFDLDDAILRRLPRRLLVDLPTLEDRKAILRILLRGETLADDVSIDDIAAKTEGFSGSDLKHLCVAAALSAVKDIVHVPWKSATEPDTPPAVPPRPVSPPAGGAREEVRLAVENETQSEPAVAQPLADLTADASPAAKEVEAAYVKQLEARAEKEADARAKEQERGASSQAGTEKSETPGSTAQSPSADEAAPAEPTPETPPQPQPLARTLTAKHFTTALSEIRPSSSEEGTLPELRKWAEMYGEGGKQKGKKSGFGKGFGFGEERLQEHKGFGRVDRDDAQATSSRR